MKLAYTTRVGYICVYTALERPGICNDPPTLTSTDKEESSCARPAQLRFLWAARTCPEELHGATLRYSEFSLRAAHAPLAHAKYQRENRGQLWISWRATRRRAFFPAKQPLARLCRGFAAKVWRAFLHYFRALRRHRGRSVLLHPGRRPVVRVCDCATCTTELCSR